jgi:glycosyltransferase involved in cell wall biosynthesis
MSTSPQLSVIIPTYNRAPLLCKAVESVLQQTLTDQEIIVVDDGSTDRTQAALEQRLSEQSAWERVRYIFQRNQGKSVALNRGLSEAKGEWIAFLDSDDLWLSNKVEEQFGALRQYSPQSMACFTDAGHVNNPAIHQTAFERAGKRYPRRTGMISDPVRLVVNPPHGIYMQTLVVHSQIMRKVGEFDPTLRIVQDSDFVFRLALETQFCFVNLPLVLVDRTPARREGLTEVLNRGELEGLDERQRLFENWSRLDVELDADIQKAIRSHLGSVYSERSNWLLKNEKYQDALLAITASARARLTLRIAAKWCLAALVPTLARNIVIRRGHDSRGLEGPAV